jgi:hypothetical protein
MDGLKGWATLLARRMTGAPGLRRKRFRAGEVPVRGAAAGPRYLSRRRDRMIAWPLFAEIAFSLQARRVSRGVGFWPRALSRWPLGQSEPKAR